MLTIAVIFGTCAILLLPFKNRFWRFFRSIIAVVMLALLLIPLTPLDSEDYVNVRIRATHRANTAAEENEIHLERVTFDGKEQRLIDLFPGNQWRIVQGRLAWRNRDPGSEAIIFDQWPAMDVYEISFQKNKWRGIAEVQIGLDTFLVDCYAPVEYGESTTLIIPGPSRSSSLAKTLKYGMIILIMVLICVLLPLLGRSKREEFRDPGPVQRQSWSDILRVLSVIAFILAASSGRVFETYGLAEPSGVGHLLMYAAESFAAPVFFMLTGSFLLHRNEDPLNTLKKRVPSVLIPLLALVALSFLSSSGLGSQGAVAPLSYMLNDLLGDHANTLLFFVRLLTLYLLAPVLRPSLLFSDSRTHVYSIVMLYIIPSIACSVLIITGQNGVLLDTLLLITCIGQFIFGAYITSGQRRRTGKWVLPLLAMLIGYALTVCMLYFMQNLQQPLNPSLYLFGFESVVYSGGMFAFFAALSSKLAKLPSRISAVVKQAASLAIGTLLIQTLLANRMPSLAVGNVTWYINADSLSGSIPMGILYFFLSLGISYIISQIPVFNRVIGLNWYSFGRK